MKIPRPEEVASVIAARQLENDYRLTDRCVRAIKGMASQGVKVSCEGSDYAQVGRVAERLRGSGWDVEHFTGDQREPCSLLIIKVPS